MTLRPFLLFTCALTAVTSLVAPARAQDTVHTCIAASTDGQTLRKDGKLLAARLAMLSCARDVCPAVVRSHCARWLTEIEGQIPTLVVRAQDAAGNDAIDARVTIDGRPAKLDGHPVPLDPGSHTVAIDGSHGAHAQERVLVVEGESARLVTLRFPGGDHPSTTADTAPAPAASFTPGARRVPVGAWLLGGAGVLSLGAGGVFALAAKSDLDGLDSTCSPHCTSDQTQTGRTHALLADVLLATGGVAVAGAVVWAIAFPSHAPAARVGWLQCLTLAPLPGGAAAGLRVSY